MGGFYSPTTRGALLPVSPGSQVLPDIGKSVRDSASALERNRRAGERAPEVTPPGATVIPAGQAPTTLTELLQEQVNQRRQAAAASKEKDSAMATAASVAYGASLSTPDEKTPPAPTNGEAWKGVPYPVPGQEVRPPSGTTGTVTMGKYQKSALEDRANARPGTANYADTRPYSEKVRGLQSEIPDTPAFDMKTKGGWTFSGGYGKGPRVGTGTLSGLEQRTARREWLDTRVKEEQGTEDADQARAVQKAKADYEMRAAAMDPTTLARIQAEGKFGPEQMRLQAQASQIDQAFRQFTSLRAAAVELRRQGRAAEADSAEEAARQLAAILLGHAPSSPRGADALAGIFGGGMTSPAAGAATTEVK